MNHVVLFCMRVLVGGLFITGMTAFSWAVGRMVYNFTDLHPMNDAITIVVGFGVIGALLFAVMVMHELGRQLNP